MIVHSEEHNHHRRQYQHPQTVLRHKVLFAAAHTLFCAPRYTVTNQREESLVLAACSLVCCQVVYKVHKESLAGQLACLQASVVQAASKARLEAVGIWEVSLPEQSAYPVACPRWAFAQVSLQQEQKAYMLKASVLEDHW